MVLRAAGQQHRFLRHSEGQVQHVVRPLRPAILTVDNLVNIRQEDGESLRSYLDRYNRMSVKIKDLSDEIARHHFSYELQPGVFADKISRKKPKIMEEMRERAAKFIQMEDMQEFRVKKRENEDTASHKSTPDRANPLLGPTRRKSPSLARIPPWPFHGRRSYRKLSVRLIFSVQEETSTSRRRWQQALSVPSDNRPHHGRVPYAPR